MLDVDVSRCLPLGVEAIVKIDVARQSLHVTLLCSYADVARLDYDPTCIPEGDSRFEEHRLEKVVSLRDLAALRDPSASIESVVLAWLQECVRELQAAFPLWPWSTACARCGSFSCDFVNCQPSVLGGSA